VLIMRRSFAAALAAFIFFIAVHLVYLSTPFVSLEFVYGRYAEILAGEKCGADLGRYLELVANPASGLFIIVPFHLLLGFSEFATRLPSFLSGVALAVLAAVAVRRIKNGKKSALAFTIMLLNPMYWVCSGLAYTDIPFCLFSGGGLLFCILALLEDRPFLHWPAAVFLSISALIKYNGLVFFPVAAIFIFIHTGKRSPRYLLPYFLLAVVIDLPVYLSLLGRYGFLIYPRLQTLHRPRPDMVHIYLPSYLLWLGLFMGPFLVLPAWNGLVSAKRRSAYLIFPAALLFPCVLYSLTGWGGGYLARLHEMGEYEMNAGWFELLLGGRALGSLILLILALVVVAVVDIVAWMRRERANLFFGIWLMAVLLSGSVSRPANRYLLFILVPISVYLGDILGLLDERLKWRLPLRIYFAASLIFLALICFFTTGFWIGARGAASADAVRYVNEHRLSPAYLDWRVTSHSLYLADESLLTDDEAGARYMVSGRAPGDAAAGGSVLFRREVSLMGRPLEIYEVVERGR